MKVTFIGATHEVTGSCTLLEVNDKRILVDCGMEQGRDLFENIEIPVAPADLDAIVLTHAHIDNSGKLPFLVSQGYQGPVYSTEATRHLCNIMLMDSAHIQEFEAQWRNRKGKRAGEEEFVPLYTTEDVQNTMKLFSTAGYDTDVELFEGISVRYLDAGHLLGSSYVLFSLCENGEKRSILFSGDIGNPEKPLIRAPQPAPHADYAVCESTYGNRLHTGTPDFIGELTAVIQRTLDRGGNVVIPAFAVGRTQELLYYLRIIKEKNLIRNHDGFPVVVDSPLAVEATNIYSTEMHEYYNDEAAELLSRGINPVTCPELKVAVSSDESKMINDDSTPKIIISASGMCEAGRIRHHLKHNLWRPECTIMFVGYQSEGTVGAKLLDGAESVKLFGEDIQVCAEIAKMNSFSSHADKNGLLRWIEQADPSVQIFINHGEDQVTEDLAMDAARLTGKPAVAPYSGDVWDLITCDLIYKAPVIPVIRKEAKGGTESGSEAHEGFKVTEATGKAVSLYEELRRTEDRLNDLIEKSRGRSNKELKAMTAAIAEILSKYK